MTGGGKDLKNQAKSNSYLYKILNITKNFIKKILVEKTSITSDRCTQNTASKLSLASCRGAILIEFAICMPILIILLFYINDLVKIKRYYSQTEFVGQQIANMIQNISQKRTDKRITKTDLQYALASSYLTIYPATGAFSSNDGKLFGNMPMVYIFYVKGEANGTASCIWCRRLHTNTRPNPSATYYENYWNSSESVVNKNGTTPADIYSTLKVNSGDYKIIIETMIWGAGFYKGLGNISLTRKQSLKTYMIEPRFTGNYSCLHSVVIFTPKPGLFSETAPQ